MKITHNKVGQNLNLTDAKKSEKAESALGSANAASAKLDALSSAEQTQKSSRVQLSERAQDMKKAKEIASNAPEIREDRVAALQKMIDEGKYNVSAKDIADKMVDEEILWA
jgi:negative regulator of flagellin synthesis FlgM